LGGGRKDFFFFTHCLFPARIRDPKIGAVRGEAYIKNPRGPPSLPAAHALARAPPHSCLTLLATADDPPLTALAAARFELAWRADALVVQTLSYLASCASSTSSSSPSTSAPLAHLHRQLLNRFIALGLWLLQIDYNFTASCCDSVILPLFIVKLGILR
jgi:condensin-2 complex subunit G2